MSCPRTAPLRRVALAAVVAVAAVGCAPDVPAPTQAQYVARADDVCQQTDDRLEELQEAYDEDLEEEAAEGGSGVDQRPGRWIRARVVPQYKKMDQTLRGIPAPEDDGPYLQDLYDDLSRAVEELRLGPSKGRDFVREDTELRNRFATYGMEVCGEV